MNERPRHGDSGASVAVVGLGNIGSQSVALLAGVERIGRVLLVDPDRYDADNLGRQRCGHAEVGRRKVDVQARALRRAAPGLRVEPLAVSVESLPLGLLRGCVILACVDSRIARQAINRCAFALGTPWIDAALDRDGQVRSRTYWPGIGDCLECAWGPADYELLEQRFACAGPVPQAPRTAAPLELGAVAAGLQVAHLRRVLSGQSPDAASRTGQWFFHVPSGRGFVGTYAPNAACRLDHSPWDITELPRRASDLPLAEALRLPAGDPMQAELTLEGQAFVHRLRCPRCGTSRWTAGRVFSRIRSRECRRCGVPMNASASESTDVLGVRTVPHGAVDAPLSAFGLVDGDIFSVRSCGTTRHFQLCG